SLSPKLRKGLSERVFVNLTDFPCQKKSRNSVGSTFPFTIPCPREGSVSRASYQAVHKLSLTRQPLVGNFVSRKLVGDFLSTRKRTGLVVVRNVCPFVVREGLYELSHPQLNNFLCLRLSQPHNSIHKSTVIQTEAPVHHNSIRNVNHCTALARCEPNLLKLRI
ncbi:hypothetical protein HHX47_DHR5000459, partial [Lentinula edodes]